MSNQQLLEPIIEGGIHSTHYFNGRRLTAEDMDREKKANRQHERLLGQAIGEGVVYGLEVGLPSGQAAEGTTLEIQKGLAINRNGDTLYLPQKISLSLVPPPEEVQFSKAKFEDCSKDGPIEIPRNTGVYAVLIRPAIDLSGRAPMSSIPDDGSIVGCGRGELVEGVQFKVVKMDLNGPAFDELDESTKTKLMEVSAKSDDKSVSIFKNIVAHACFGTEEIRKFIEDPFGGNDFSSYGAMDKLRSLAEDSKYKITDNDVPLAILRWTQKKIQFVDMWAVRRRPYEPTPPATWPTLIGPRRLAVAEAIFFQFQEQIIQMTTLNAIQSQLASIEVSDYFVYLPALGLIPITGIGSSTGFDYLKFFNNLTIRNPVHLEGQKIDSLIHNSLIYSPIALNSKELIWLYIVRENMELVSKNTINRPQPYIIFANANIPYQGNARFNINRWDFSNYAKI